MLWLVAHEDRAISSASPCHVLRNSNGLGNFFWKHVSKSSCVVSMLSRDLKKGNLGATGILVLMCVRRRANAWCFGVVNAEGECMQSSETTQGCLMGVGWSVESKLASDSILPF